MLLRGLAKLHARMRRRFFRLPRFARWLASVLAVIVVLGLGELVLAVGFARANPYFQSSIGMYMQWVPKAAINQHVPDLLVLAYPEGWSLWQYLLASDGEAYVFRYADHPSVIIRHPKNLPSPLPEGWGMHIEEVGKTRYGVLYQSNLPPRTKFIWAWWKPMRLHALQQQYDAVGLVQERQSQSYQPVFIGLLAYDDHWIAAVSAKTAALRGLPGAATGQAVNAARLQSSREIASALQTSILHSWFAGQHPVWQALAKYPVELRIGQGKLAALSDPFADGLTWAATVQVPQEQAQQLLQSILDSLMKQFPLATERALPDKSQVYELRRSQDFFLGSNQALDLAISPTGTFTFPHDQLTYRHENGTLMLQKGDEGIWPSQTAQNPCPLTAPLLFGHMSGSFMGVSMWKELFFGLDKDKITACVNW